MTEFRATEASGRRAALRVVIAGGGIAGAEALLALHDLAGERVELTLITPSADLAYRPLAVAEPFGLGHVKRYPLDELVHEVDGRRIEGSLVEVDVSRREVVLEDGRRVAFDALLVAVGARAVAGVEFATTWWPEGDPELYGGLLRDVEEGYVHRILFAVPSGAVWPLHIYELALMTARDGAAMGMQPEITVVTPEAVPLALFGTTAAKALSDELRSVGIRLETATLARVEAGAPYSVVLQPSVRRVVVDRVIAIPEVVGPALKGLPHDDRGFIPIEADGRVRGSERVWAAGDGIAYPVKYGGLATQQADVAAIGIARLAGAEVADVPRHLVLRGMLMTGARPRALGKAEAPRVPSSPLWEPEGKVHGRYLSPYLERAAGHPGPDPSAEDAGVVVEEVLPALDSDAAETFSALWPSAPGRDDFLRRLGAHMHEYEDRLEDRSGSRRP